MNGNKPQLLASFEIWGCGVAKKMLYYLTILEPQASAFKLLKKKCSHWPRSCALPDLWKRITQVTQNFLPKYFSNFNLSDANCSKLLLGKSLSQKFWQSPTHASGVDWLVLFDLYLSVLLPVYSKDGLRFMNTLGFGKYSWFIKTRHWTERKKIIFSLNSCSLK